MEIGPVVWDKLIFTFFYYGPVVFDKKIFKVFYIDI